MARLTGAQRPAPPTPLDASYALKIQPIFDNRCVVCHGCFDSACQLSLQSFEGFDRGANKSIVYFPERVEAARPTRMFQDAQTTAQWESQFDFFPVVDRAETSDLGSDSIWRFVLQRVAQPLGGVFDVNTTTSCPRGAAETQKELQAHPERGMPFGFPPLAPDEVNTIAAWLRNGAGGPGAESDRDSHQDASESASVNKWEGFFNGSDPRTPLVSGYLFEHLFYAHLVLDGHPGTGRPGPWFRLVRSRTPTGSPIEEIATRRPYDDPGAGRFYYRLRRIRETLVAKTHVPYVLDDAKLARLSQLFYAGDWTAPPGLDRLRVKHAANPFLTFAAIPARSRYQFFLDDARYFVQTFINGPVCRGQAALDVIDEQFLIFFLSPDADPAVTDAHYLAAVAPDLDLPAEGEDRIEALSPAFEKKELAYLRQQVPREKARTLADVWHGDGKNPNAVLTVFRHFDTAYVAPGALGGMPKTAWVMDYPIFERIYYDLVAGFDVYGNFAHQIGTRIYMNLLRIESEGQFLRFVPAADRPVIFGEWYRNRVAKALADIHATAYAGPETGIAYTNPGQAKQEFLNRLLIKELPPAVAGPREPIQWTDVPLSTDRSRARFEAAMRPLMNRVAPYVAVFPDTVLLRVNTGNGENLAYTIARNRAHASVELIFSEGVELQPQEDTLQIVSGIVTSRPNFLLSVDEARLNEFTATCRALLSGDESWACFLSTYGARRSDPTFLNTFDFFGTAMAASDPLGAAVLDLSRYGNE